MNDENCNCDGCIHVEEFKAITRSYEGAENEVTETLVDNDISIK